ncbi:MAG: phosphotransferase [Bacteroidales bacterium]|nr:phosphotransferase [Candidatus Colimorpha onthohippi]
MEARKINLQEWEMFGDGATSDSYNHRTNPDVMLKLFHAGYPEANVEIEFQRTQVVYDMGIRSPKAIELVTADGLLGIIYQRIQNKKSFNRIIADDHSQLENVITRFANMTKLMHGTPCLDPIIPNYKQFYLDALKLNTYIPESQKPTVANYIFSMPNERYCIHGDLHAGNVISNPDGDFFIDLGSFTSGTPYIDLSMYYFVTHSEDKFVENIHHNDHKTLMQCWDVFRRVYFGSNVTEQQVEDVLMPFLAVRSISLEVEAHHTEPLFDELRKKYILR